MDSSTVPSPETGSQYTFSDLAYQCGPDGAQFSPAITITFTLSQNQWDTLTANGREPVIREYSTSTNTWETLPTDNRSCHQVGLGSGRPFLRYCDLQRTGSEQGYICRYPGSDNSPEDGSTPL